MKKLLKLYRMFYRLLRLKETQRNEILRHTEFMADFRAKHFRYAYDTIFSEYQKYRDIAVTYGCKSATELEETIKILCKVFQPKPTTNNNKESKMNETDKTENADNRVQPRPRSNEDLLFELTKEYCFVSDNLRKLGNAIKADPATVRQEHKDLWKQQAEHMTGYKNVLADRIKDILNNN